MTKLSAITRLMILGILRDKVLRIVFISGLLFLCLAPALSSLSMRQVQQLLTTISLSWISLTLLLLALILGSTSVWRDMDRRWLSAVLGLPISRSHYLFSRVFSASICLFIAGLFLGGVGTLLLLFFGSDYSTAKDFSIAVYWISVLFIILKYLLVSVVATVFSVLSTSLFLPIFATVAIIFTGTASQGVIDYLATADAQNIAAATKFFAKIFYYIIPNFSLFDYSTQAIYGLPVSLSQLLLPAIYFVIYFVTVFFLALFSLQKRELQ